MPFVFSMKCGVSLVLVVVRLPGEMPIVLECTAE